MVQCSQKNTCVFLPTKDTSHDSGSLAECPVCRYGRRRWRPNPNGQCGIAHNGRKEGRFVSWVGVSIRSWNGMDEASNPVLSYVSAPATCPALRPCRRRWDGMGQPDRTTDEGRSCDLRPASKSMPSFHVCMSRHRLELVRKSAFPRGILRRGDVVVDAKTLASTFLNGCQKEWRRS